MKTSFSSQDEDFMRQALALALRGQGRVEPNPMVGCVLVRDGAIVGRGYHRRFGGPHAEVEAIRNAGPAARGATAYVTLEPCCHYGKTPPCTGAIIVAGIRRVVAAMADPFAKVAGGGIRQLCGLGIPVAVGLCRREAMWLNAPYLKRQLTGRPWVILKWAQSVDGCIATRCGESRWISSEESRRRAHALRGRVDAIIVGVGTVLADDPELTCRHVKPRRVAVRIVLDPHLRTPPHSRLVRTARKVPTVIATLTEAMTGRQAKTLQNAGVELLPVPRGRTGLHLQRLLATLARRGMSNVLVEGGGKTIGALYDAGLADEAVVFLSRRLIGGAGAHHPLAGVGPARMRELKAPCRSELLSSGSDDLYRLVFTDPTAL